MSPVPPSTATVVLFLFTYFAKNLKKKETLTGGLDYAYPMKITVTGAAGFFGGNLVRALIREGHDVRAVVRKSTAGIEGLPVEVFRGNVCDMEDMSAAFAGADVVFHCAAVVSIQGSLGGRVERVNVEGVQNVVRAALACGVKKYVHISSVHALDPAPHDAPIRETRQLCGGQSHHPAYARSKANGERAVLAGVAQGLDGCILNPSGMMGPYDFVPSPIGEALQQMRDGQIPALVNGGYNWVDVRDVVQSAIQAMTKGRAGERYLVTGRSTSVRELAEVAGQVTGRKPPIFTCPLWVAQLVAPVLVWLSKLFGVAPLFTPESLQVLGDNDDFDHSKAASELGHAPRPLIDTLTDTYAWMSEVD
jgi:dihydroflavonol-4-reductase